MIQIKNGSINSCVLFPTSRFPYLICITDSGNGRYLPSTWL